MPFFTPSVFYFIAYVFFVFVFTGFFNYDAEYFLFFTSTALFFIISININSFLEATIKARYSLYISNLKILNSNISLLINFSKTIESYLSSLFEFLLVSETQAIQVAQEIEEFAKDQKFINAQIDNFYYDLVREGAPLFPNSRKLYKSLVFNQQLTSLIIKLVKDPRFWRRRTRVPLSRYWCYRKFFNVPKKYPVVVIPYRPGEYKGTPYSKYDL